MISRHCPVGIEATELEPPRLYLTGQVVNQAHQILNGETDDKNGKQIGNIIDYTYQYVLDRVPDIRKYLIGQPLGLWEDSELKGNGNQQLEKHDYVAQQIGKEDQQVDLPLRIQ